MTHLDICKYLFDQFFCTDVA